MKYNLPRSCAPPPRSMPSPCASRHLSHQTACAKAALSRVQVVSISCRIHAMCRDDVVALVAVTVAPPTSNALHLDCLQTPMRGALTSFQDGRSSGVDGRPRRTFPLFVQHSRRGCWPWSLLCHHCDGWQSGRPVHWTTYHLITRWVSRMLRLFVQRRIGLDVPFARSCFCTCWWTTTPAHETPWLCHE